MASWWAQHWIEGSGFKRPDQGHCVVFLGKTLYSHRASPHPGVQMGTGKFNAEGNPAMDWHPVQAGVEVQRPSPFTLLKLE